MPVVRVEKRENLFKRLVGNVNLRVVLLQIMHLEQATVEIRDFAEQGRQLGRAVGFGLTQALVKQPQQEQPVETEKVALALLLAHPVQPVAQIIWISVEKTPLLNEVNEHHSVQHQRGVPLAVSQILDPLNKRQKRAVFFFEAVIESLGDFLHIESRTHSARHIDKGEVFLFLQRDRDLL